MNCSRERANPERVQPRPSRWCAENPSFLSSFRLYIYIYIYIWNFTKKFLFFLSSKFLIFLSLLKKIKGFPIIYIYIYIWNFTKKFLFFLSSKFLIFLSLFKKIKGGKKIDILPYLKYPERVDWYLPYFPHASFSSPPRQHRTANSLIRRRCSNNLRLP